MADIAVVAAKVAPVFTKYGKAEIYDGVAGATITAGQAVAINNSTGLVHPADATAGGGYLIQFKGIALNGGGAGQAISFIVHGMVYGFTLAGVDYGAKVYLSETVGALSDADVGTTCEVGEVWPLSDASVTKVLFVDVNIGDEAHS